MRDASEETQWSRWRGLADLYHAYFTGLILTVVTRRGAADAAELVFRIFRRQQEERFLPGLEKLGLTHLPPAVAAAQYHYLSNWIGGVPVEYMYESDRKAWIRYPPPRWIWRGTAICAIPTEVSRAMLRGWHANNGVALANPRLGFVCTKQAIDGDDGLEGFYCEYDEAIDVDRRLVFAPHLEAPPFEASRAPALPTSAWPRPRLEKAHRDYAMDYVRTAAPVAVQLFGALEGGHLLHRTGRLIGMQFFDDIAGPFGARRGSATDFAGFLHALFAAQDDAAAASESSSSIEVRQESWRLMADVADYHPACAQVLIGLIEGMAQAFGRHVSASFGASDRGRPPFHWRIAKKTGY